MVKKAKSSTDDKPQIATDDKTASSGASALKGARLPHGLLNGLLHWVAIILAVAAIIGLLTYDIWGERWLAVTGRSDATAQPHNHSAIGQLREQNTEQAAEILALASRLQNIRTSIDELQAERQSLSEQSARRLALLEDLQASLAQQGQALENQSAALSALQNDTAALKNELAQNPDTLASLIGLVRERRNVGKALENIPALLRAFAGDNAVLLSAADTLQDFADSPVPSDSDLVADYRALQPQITVAFGAVPLPTDRRDFWLNLKNYIASLVTIRKLDERLRAKRAAVPLDSLSDAVAERNFVAVYEWVARLSGENEEIDAWLDKLQARNRADAAVIALQDYLRDNIEKRLIDKQNNGEAG